MTDKEDKSSSTIDKKNKVSETPDFDAFRFWLKQQRRREKTNAKARRDGENDAVTHRKSRLK